MKNKEVTIPEWINPKEINIYLIRNRIVEVKKTLAELLDFANCAGKDIHEEIKDIVSGILGMLKKEPDSLNIWYIFDNEREWADWKIPTSVVSFNREIEKWSHLLDDFIEVLPHRMH